MNPFESFLVELLQGHIEYDDESVEVRRQFLPSANLPCITLEVVRDKIRYYRRTYNDNKEQLEFTHECDMYIHSWCNTESARESINTQILSQYVHSLNHHYMYCSNYEEGICSYLKRQCRAIGTTKSKCPLPESYGYTCLSDKHGLKFGTVLIEVPFFADEVNEKPPILHSIFEAHTDYVEVVSNMGDTTEDIRLDIDVI